MSSGVSPVVFHNSSPHARSMGDVARSGRSATMGALASEHAYGNTHWSSGTPKARARSTVHITMPAAWSTCSLDIMSLVYGKPTMRLAGEGFTIWSAVYGVRSHAYGLLTATSLNLTHSFPR